MKAFLCFGLLCSRNLLLECLYYIIHNFSALIYMKLVFQLISGLHKELYVFKPKFHLENTSCVDSSSITTTFALQLHFPLHSDVFWRLLMKLSLLIFVVSIIYAWNHLNFCRMDTFRVLGIKKVFSISQSVNFFNITSLTMDLINYSYLLEKGSMNYNSTV